MNDYIINPMFFYWVSVADTAKFMLEILGTIGIAIGIAFWIKGCVDLEFAYGKTETEEAKKTRRMSIITALISIGIIFGGVFIPSENTLIKMQVAKFGTYDNAEKVVQVIDKKTDALIDAIAGHNKESDENDKNHN